MVENFAAIAFQSLEKPLKFWRTKNKAEVDFVLESEGKLTAIEVKAGKENNVPSSLRSFMEKYHPDKTVILNSEITQKKKIDDQSVNFLPFWQNEKFL
jgi:predicted AAA+ superfamily ATPase